MTAAPRPLQATSATSAVDVLELRGFGVAYAQKVVLAEVDLRVQGPGIVVLVGPAGTGKSTLLRTLCGHNSANPSVRTWGHAAYLGRPLGESDAQPSLVAQSARLMMSSVFENVASHLAERERLTRAQQRECVEAHLREHALDALLDRLDQPVVGLALSEQRQIAILRAAMSEPPLLCIDEPTSDLAEPEARRLIAQLHREAELRALIVTTHQQTHARWLGGRIALLAGGRIQEVRDTRDFFDAPRTRAGAEFVRSGTCLLPAPDADPAELDESVPPPPPLPLAARAPMARAFGPRGFLWVRPGQLAGTPLPGVFHDCDYDLAALRRVGIRHLINLTEQNMAAEIVAPYGIDSHWFPVVDMTPPSMAQAEEICRLIDRLIASEEPVAVHCRAGLGRTGTVLAMYLIWTGRAGLQALEEVRRIEPRWVQSEVQVQALEAFAVFCARRRVGAKAPRREGIAADASSRLRGD